MAKEGRTETTPLAEIDEIALWNLMQKEGGSPVGLTLWFVWQHSIGAKELLALTWEQVNLAAGEVYLPKRTVSMSTTLVCLLRQEREKRGEDADPHVLLSPVAQKPYDSPRLSKLMKTALIRSGITGVTLDVLSRMRRKKDGDEQILAQAEEEGFVTRSSIMTLLDLTEAQTYERLRRLMEQKKLVRVGTKYYPAESIVPPEEHYNKIYEYLKKMEYAFRQDIADLLHLETRQCSWILRGFVSEGKLVKEGQRYSLPEEKNYKS